MKKTPRLSGVLSLAGGTSREKGGRHGRLFI